MTQYFVVKSTTELNSKEASIAPIPPQVAPSAPILFSNISIVLSWLSKEFLVKPKQLKPPTGTNNKKLYT